MRLRLQLGTWMGQDVPSTWWAWGYYLIQLSKSDLSTIESTDEWFTWNQYARMPWPGSTIKGTGAAVKCDEWTEYNSNHFYKVLRTPYWQWAQVTQTFAYFDLFPCAIPAKDRDVTLLAWGAQRWDRNLGKLYSGVIIGYPKYICLGGL